MNSRELKLLQNLDLNTKILKSKQRIREWVEYWGDDGVYVSWSGGKDSSVLLDLVRKEYPEVPAVFCDTGLEYPEIKEFVYKKITDRNEFREIEKYGYIQRYYDFDNIVIIRPKMSFREVLNKWGLIIFY